MKFFRIPASLVNDKTIQRLPADCFRCYINLLALAEEKGDSGSVGTLVDIDWHLRGSSLEMVNILLDRGLVIKAGDNYRVLIPCA